jgi:hypothetical protein
MSDIKAKLMENYILKKEGRKKMQKIAVVAYTQIQDNIELVAKLTKEVIEK